MRKIVLAFVVLLVISTSIAAEENLDTPQIPPLPDTTPTKDPPASISASVGKKCEEEPLVINSVDFSSNLAIFNSIKKCVEEKGHATAYVFGTGGAADEAMAFFDLMRTSGLSKHTTFIATAMIWSASNVVWLAAETRIVLPGSQFVIHDATLNMTNETREIRDAAAVNGFDLTTAAVRLSAGEKGAAYWAEAISAHNPGTILNAKQAFEYGWATEIRGYEDAPKN